ncbi:MAG: hypothetical protein EON54_17035 [Alcaligenaceae bacterium]|nr:MAG: hypothetical protein EON54_17035 [Alcaligenaceae bacterium]
MKLAHAALLIGVSTLTGCAVNPPQTDNLQRTTDNTKTITLNSDFCGAIPGAFGTAPTLCLAQGTYRADRHNQFGQFYRNDLPSVYHQVRNDFHVHMGGIWVPTDATDAPRAFYDVLGGGTGKSLAEAKAASVENSSKLKQSAPANSVNSVAISNTPTNVTPMQAGVGAGLASGIVASFIDFDTPATYPAFKTGDFSQLVKDSMSKP